MTVKISVKEQAHQHTKIEVPIDGDTIEVIEEQGPVGPEIEWTGENLAALASVTLNLSYTKNLGDYNSLKVSVGVTVPCMNDPNQIAKGSEWAKEFCESKIQEILDES